MTITVSGRGATSIAVADTAVPIPMGCICSYTWNLFVPGGVIRNGALPACPADHGEVAAR